MDLNINMKQKKDEKPPYVVAKDDTKPLLQDPLWSSDPNQAEQAVLRLPPFTVKSKAQQK
ncbi:uncharacterized protein LOC130828886 [Amaranthus tricolor]|uniref:uncharacterized protein LOC130828886 n=1 Tax=Amaranthus tricolor TaxID=29722 RepID=UPI00258A16BC|nr:uncharacterized protein LOC130828886 [Amaranthus tricolor]